MNGIEYIKQISDDIQAWLYQARPDGSSNHWFVDNVDKRFHAISYANGVDSNAGYTIKLVNVISDQLAKTNRKIEFINSGYYNRIWLFDNAGILLNNSSVSNFSVREISFILPQTPLIDAIFFAMNCCRNENQPHVFSVILFTTTPIIR